ALIRVEEQLDGEGRRLDRLEAELPRLRDLRVQRGLVEPPRHPVVEGERRRVEEGLDLPVEGVVVDPLVRDPELLEAHRRTPFLSLSTASCRSSLRCTWSTRASMSISARGGAGAWRRGSGLAGGGVVAAFASLGCSGGGAGAATAEE